MNFLKQMSPFKIEFADISKFDARMRETPRAETLRAMAQRFGEASSIHRKNPKQAHRGSRKGHLPRR